MTTCSGEDSFNVVSAILYPDYMDMNGCYGLVGSFATYYSTNYFLNDSATDGYPFFRTDGNSSGNYYSNDVWVLAHWNQVESTFSPKCISDEEDDALTMHPTAVSEWKCYDYDTGDFTILDAVTTTCGCSTPTPTPASSATPEPTPAPTPTPEPTPAFTPTPERAPAPAPTPDPTPALTPTPELTPAPAVSTLTAAPAGVTLAPTATSPPTTAVTTAPLSLSSDGNAGATTVGIAVGVVAGALAVTALGFFLRRRRAATKEDADPRTPHPDGVDNLEHGCGDGQQRDVSPPYTYGVSGPPPQQNSSPPPYTDTHQRDVLPPPYQPAVVAAERNIDDGNRARSLAAAPFVGIVQSSTEHTAHPGKGGGKALAGGDTEGSSAEQLLLTATNSTANVSTEERTEFAGIGFSPGEDDVPLADGPMPASGESGARSTASRRGTPSGIGIGQAVMEAAHELAHHCQIPGVSEAATVVSILVNLVVDSRDDMGRGDARVKRCRSIVMMLERAAKVLGRGGDTNGEVERVLIEDVHDAIFDLVELIKTYQSKNKLSKVFMSTLFKRRQDELDAVVDRAVLRLHLGLQVQVGHDVCAVKEGMQLHMESVAEGKPEYLAEARSARRQRKLDQVEIPQDHVVITDELLGKGGFGEVFIADYNGRNAAAKVLSVDNDFGRLGQDDVLDGPKRGHPDAMRERSQRKAFLRELDAMIRLRSPHTVNVYGAITSLPGCLVLVMELLAGGDLRNMLKNAEQPLPEEQSRRIIRDICAGMAFLHSKATVHGDLKSANVLLDGRGRAKIGDFGTSRWAQNTESTGLATYTTKAGQSTQISIAWTAPEVLETKEVTNSSDVYSFGVVVWEVLSRKIPWADQALPRDIYLRVVFRGDRPAIPLDAPVDLVHMLLGCWAQAPEERPTFHELMDKGKADRRR